MTIESEVVLENRSTVGREQTIFQRSLEEERPRHIVNDSPEVDDGVAPTDLLEELRRSLQEKSSSALIFRRHVKKAHSDQHATEVLSRTIGDEIFLLGVSLSRARIEDDTSLQDHGFRIERTGFESGDNALTFDKMACIRPSAREASVLRAE